MTQRLTLLECECYLGHSLTFRHPKTQRVRLRTSQSSIQCFYDGARQFSRSHHFCRLALLEVKGGALTLKDCRTTFPPLTEFLSPITHSLFTIYYPAYSFE